MSEVDLHAIWLFSHWNKQTGRPYLEEKKKPIRRHFFKAHFVFWGEFSIEYPLSLVEKWVDSQFPWFKCLGGLDLFSFVMASAISRSARFLLVAAAIYRFGVPVMKFINRWFNLLTISFAILLIGSFIVLKMITHPVWDLMKSTSDS